MIFCYGFIVLLLTVFWAEPAYAWGPATHLEYAQNALSAIALFAPAVKKLLSKHTDHFLYGSVAPDITLGKNLRGYLYNCHNWNVALDLFHKKAKKDHQRAFMLGFLAHLAADTVAHNFFVPFKVIKSWETRLLKHVYWEMRMDLTVAEKHWNQMEYFARHPFHEDDILLEQHLKRTLFSFQTNKKIFNSLVMLQQLKQYKKVAHQVAKNSRWGLKAEDVRLYKKLAQTAVIDFLTQFEKSYCLHADPTGKLKLLYARETASKLKAAKKQKKLGQENIQRLLQDIKKEMQTGIYQPTPLPEVHTYIEVNT